MIIGKETSKKLLFWPILTSLLLEWFVWASVVFAYCYLIYEKQLTILGVVGLWLAHRVGLYLGGRFYGLCHKVMTRSALRKNFGDKFTSWEDLDAWLRNITPEELEKELKKNSDDR